MDTMKHQFPRISELAIEANGKFGVSSYFNGVEKDIRQSAEVRRFYCELERELQCLNPNAWVTLKRKCFVYAAKQSPRRGWDQLVSILNEAKGYCLLQTLGYTELKFVEEDQERTPDVSGELRGSKAVVEVKTIQKSDDAISRQRVLEHEPLEFFKLYGYDELDFEPG